MKRPWRLFAILSSAAIVGVFVFWKSSPGYLVWMVSDLAWVGLALLLFRDVRPHGSAGGGDPPGGTDRTPPTDPDRSEDLVGAGVSCLR